MAKICSNCHNIIDDNCEKCPICNEEFGLELDINRKSKNHNANVKAIIAVTLISAFIIIGLTYSIKTFVIDKVENDASDNTIIYKIGETIHCSSADYTVKSINFKEQGTPLDGVGAEYIENPEWIGIILKIYNTSNVEQSFKVSDIELINSNNETLNRNFIRYGLWNANPLEDTLISSKKQVTGYIQYMNTNTDNSKLTLKIKCDNMFNEDTYTIDLSQ